MPWRAGREMTAVMAATPRDETVLGLFPRYQANTVLALVPHNAGASGSWMKRMKVN